MKKNKLSTYIPQSLICVGGLMITIATLSISQDRLSANSIEQHSIPQNPKHLCKSVPASQLFARTELFFGLSKPNGTEVQNAEFQQFLNREVTPRFPDGFTVLSGQGQFKDDSGVILKERSKLLILLNPIAASNNQKIEEIRKAYIKAFQQQSVLRADELSCASF
jgi:Protein of unknown function (DUF3574)